MIASQAIGGSSILPARTNEKVQTLRLGFFICMMHESNSRVPDGTLRASDKTSEILPARTV